MADRPTWQQEDEEPDTTPRVQEEALHRAAGYTAIPNAILWAHRDLSDGALMTYMALKHFAWQDPETFVGQETLAEFRGCGERSIRRHLAELKDAGLVDTKQQGLGDPNISLLQEIPVEDHLDFLKKWRPKRYEAICERQDHPTETGQNRPVKTGQKWPVKSGKKRPVKTGTDRPVPLDKESEDKDSVYKNENERALRFSFDNKIDLIEHLHDIWDNDETPLQSRLTLLEKYSLEALQRAAKITARQTPAEPFAYLYGILKRQPAPIPERQQDEEPLTDEEFAEARAIIDEINAEMGWSEK